MFDSVLFVHGAWLTPAVWSPWQKRFEAMGLQTLAPAWPGLERSIQDLRRAPPPDLAKLTLSRIADAYAKQIFNRARQPLLIGHSYGGLVVQMLLERGFGAAGVSICPAPAAGIKPGPKAFRAALPVFLAWAGWNRSLRMGYRAFTRDFATGMPADEQRAFFDRHVVPAPGRLYYQSVLGIGSGIDWARSERAPLLLVAAGEDRTVEPSMVRQNLQRYQRSSAVTELLEFPHAGHLMISATGWERVADSVLQWARNQELQAVSHAGPALSAVRSAAVG